MIVFPVWSDLSRTSNAMRMAWESELAIRDKYRRYFDGFVFQEKVPLEQGLEGTPGEEVPLMYPVGLNLVKMLCLAQTDSAFGEWEDRVVNWETRQDDLVSDASKAAIDLLNDIMTNSSFNSTLWEVELERNIYGGGAIKILPDLQNPGHIRWDHIPLEGFFPVWNPENPNELLEVYTVIAMSAEQAAAQYGLALGTVSNQIVQRIEHWTRTEYTNVVEGVRIDAYSGVNPWGFIPFVYVPRFRTTNWWGDAMTEEVITVQNELNMRVADIGDSLNYNSHPVRWGVNLPRSFNAKNFPLDPNAMWDLGRTIGNSPAPQVGLLEAKNPAPDGAFNYVKFLYDWARTSSFAPPIAFGEDDNSAVKGGPVLEIRMWPLIKYVRRSRAYMGEGLLRAARMSALILKQKRLSDVPSRALDQILSGNIVPRFADIMPKDHQAIVDEVVKLMSTEPISISEETAQKTLGRGTGEVDRIKAQLKDKVLTPPIPDPKSNNTKEALAGKETPQPEVDA